jgi:hypothetical protein
MKTMLAIVTVVVMGFGSMSVSGHENFRIVGTLTKVTDRVMEVKDKEGKPFTVNLTKRTILKRDKEKDELALTVLRVGQSVVVEAYGDNESDLEALDIRIVPPIRSKPAK